MPTAEAITHVNIERNKPRPFCIYVNVDRIRSLSQPPASRTLHAIALRVEEGEQARARAKATENTFPSHLLAVLSAFPYISLCFGDAPATAFNL